MNDKFYKDSKKFFLRFLKENNVYSRYTKYIKNQNYHNCYQQCINNWSFDSCAKTNGFRNIISILITWDKTPEGYDFWCDLNEKFNRCYDEKF